MNGQIYSTNAGPEGTASQVKERWDVHDLWANRMDEVTAKGLIDGNVAKVDGANVTAYYYNATKTSYAKGLSQNNTLLLGKYTGQVGPGPKAALSTMAPRHGVAMMRLRKKPSTTSRHEL
jgi:alpha-galactosidase